jgi:hypothetical protein
MAMHPQDNAAATPYAFHITSFRQYAAGSLVLQQFNRSSIALFNHRDLSD